jgi:hypothetical protein
MSVRLSNRIVYGYFVVTIYTLLYLYYGNTLRGCGERVSARPIPDLRENTGNFIELRRIAPASRQHPQGIGGEIPY